MNDWFVSRANRVDLADLATGLIFLAIAGLYAGATLFGLVGGRPLVLGTARSMGPGYFPIMVSIALAILGLVIVGRSFGRGTETAGLAPARALVLVLAAPIVFGLAVQPLGFVAAVGLMTFCAAWSSAQMTLRLSLVVTLCLTLLSVGLFHKLLGMSVALFGPWFGV